MKILYTRVSTLDQSDERQLQEVSQYGRIYSDKATGTNANRPQLKLMLESMREGDSITVHSIDRLARSVLDMGKLVKQITDAGVSLTFIKENLTFTGDDNPMNKMMLSILASIYEFETEIRKQRQLEGIAIAKTKGVYTGRTADMRKRAEVRDLLQAGGHTQKEIAKSIGVSVSTVKRIKAEIQ